MRPARRTWAWLLAATAVLAAACVPPPVHDTVAAGAPGSPGPCSVRRSDLRNPADGRFTLALYEPSGGAAPWTGGTCGDDDRPAVLVAHGYTATASELYQGMIDHLVGNGFVVVHPGYTTDYDPVHQYGVVDAGFVHAVAASGRVDTSRIGVVGHSFGAGMTPWLVQRAAARGWGVDGLFAVLFAPWFSQLVGDGRIDLPEPARVAVVAYEEDYFVDARIGIETFHALDVPAEHKVHLTLFTDRSVSPPLVADHGGPLSVQLLPFLGPLSTDHYDRWPAWRTIDAVAGCALDGRWCDADLADNGRFPDGRAVRRGVLSADPVDVGPPALQECSFPLNQRRCP